MHVSSASLSILSNNPSGALGVDTITIYGFDFAIYLSETSLASACCPGGKKSASCNRIKDTLGKPRYYRFWIQCCKTKAFKKLIQNNLVSILYFALFYFFTFIPTNLLLPRLAKHLCQTEVVES